MNKTFKTKVVVFRGVAVEVETVKVDISKWECTDCKDNRLHCYCLAA